MLTVDRNQYFQLYVFVYITLNHYLRAIYILHVLRTQMYINGL